MFNKNKETNLAEELADDSFEGSSKLSWEKSVDNRIDGRVTVAKPAMKGFVSSWTHQRNSKDKKDSPEEDREKKVWNTVNTCSPKVR